MAKRSIKNWSKRAFAIFLSLVMMTSLLQLSVYAYPNQVMDGYYTVDAEGNAAPTDATSVTEDGFTLSKTIKQTDENEFEITLTVETSQTVTTNDAAVQLVIDASTSMSECGSSCGKNRCDHDSRLEAIQKILTQDNGFLDSLASANSGKVYVSVIKFNYGARTEIEWTDIKTPSGLAAVKRAVNGLTQQTGTNIYGGLMLARNRWGMDAVENVSAKYTILLSDGEAHHSSRESTRTDEIAGTGTSGSATTLAASMAAEVKGLSSVYAVGYGVQKSYLESIVGEGDHVMVGEDSETISTAFANIAQSATSGMTGGGTTVTDPMGQYLPMGQYIILGDLSADAVSNGASANGNAISWALDPANAKTKTEGNTTTYTYSITYPITLDPTVEGFQEKNKDGSTKYYPANGYTYLSVPQADGSVKPIAFLVPGVCGTVPSVEWTLEYYLQEDAEVGDYDSYTLDNSSDQGEVKLWTTVSAPEGYENEYTRDNYEFEAGNVKLEITPTGEKVMRLYYKHITSAVTVNHFYKTDVINADGSRVDGTYPETPQKTSTHIEKVSQAFQAEPELEYDQAMYELVEADPVNGAIHVRLDAEKNVINMYYSRLVDNRKETSAQINHVYTTYGYELQDGKYEMVELGSVEEIAEQHAQIRATTMVDVSDQPIAGREDFTLNPELGDYPELYEGGMSFQAMEDPTANIRTLYFEKVIDERVPASIVVYHYYTKTVTSVTDGVVETVVAPDGELGNSVAFNVYVGETFTAAEINEYLGDIYESDAGNADKLVIESVGAEGASIDLYYSLTVVPPKASLLVNHYWRTYHFATVELTEEVADPDTGETTTVVVGTTTEMRETLDHSVEEIEVNDLYEGQSYTAPKQEWGEDYYFNEEESNDTGIAGTDVVLNLYYDRYTDGDEREEAFIDVQHNYTTKLTTVMGGEVVTITQADGTVTEEHAEGLAGDEFTAVANPSYNDNDYIQTTDSAALGPVILQPGTNATIVINYEREASDLVETKYAVNYEYHTYNMTIGEDGVAGYYDEPIVEYGDPAAGGGYVGQSISFGDGKREGFDALDGNPATTQILKADGNEWTFVYEKYVPLAKGSVVVNHYYSLQTIAIDGTSTWSSSSVLGTPAEKYLGEFYTAEPVLDGYDKMDAILDGASFAEPYALTVSGDHVVDFHYKKVIDNSVLAPYSITHKYYLYDWDGTLISGPAEDLAPAVTGHGYVTTIISASPEPSDYTLTGATYNGSDLGELEGSAYSIVLQDGSNDVVFVYEKTLARDLLDVTIIHNYYQDEAAMNAGAEPLAQHRDTASNIPEGESYTAEVRNQEGYTFHSATPENLTVRVTDEADHVIILNYIRASAEYEVIHIYNTNGVEDGRTSETRGGLDGDVVSAESIARVTAYNDNNYNFVSITGDITLDADAVQTITLTYNRTVVTPPPGPGPDPDPGPTPDPTPDPDPDPVDIPDEDPPLADLPEEEVPLADLPEEEIPLADVPQTGDPMILWASLSALSGMGLIGLGLTGKKRREDEAV